MILGTLMAKEWENQGLRQQDFFAESGIATGTWSRIMRGQAHFQVEDMRAACQVLGWQVSDLTAKADSLANKLESDEDILIASKTDLQEKGATLPSIIAVAALGFLLLRLLKS